MGAGWGAVPSQRVWAWFETARTAEQIASRLLVAIAAAHSALDECYRTRILGTGTPMGSSPGFP